MPRCLFSTDALAPSTMLRFWQQHLGEARVTELTLREQNRLAGVCLGYMLRIYTFTNMVQMLRDTAITVAEIRKLRQALASDFRMVLGLKMVIIRCMAREMQNMPRRLKREIRLVNEEILRMETRVGVQTADSILLLPTDRALYDNLERFGLREPLQKLLPELPVEIIPSVTQVVRECGALLADLEGFINRFVFRKHRFVIRSQNMHPHDITGELYFKATCAFYLYTPFQTAEHRANSVKRAIHNQGMQIIDHYSSKRPENSRLRQDHNGDWYNIIRTDNNMFQHGSAAAIYHPPEYIARTNYDIGLSNFTRVENYMVVRNYIEQHGKLADDILQLLTLQDDDGFIAFVQQRTNDRELDNNELIYNRLGRKQYFRLMAGYLQVPVASVKGVVSDLRGLLAP